MAQATIVRAWRDDTNAYAAAVVNDGPPRGTVEYIAQTPLVDAQGATKTSAQLKADLVAALKALRDQQLAGPAALAGVSGTVTI
jgi:hypothetical protein